MVMVSRQGSRNKGRKENEKDRPMFPDLTRDDVYRLETARLWLRWPRVTDARTIQTLAGEKAVSANTARIPHPYPAAAADSFIFASREMNSSGKGLVLAIAPKSAPHDLIGMMGLEAGSDGKAELGYWLGQPYWGKGFATEAAQALIDAAFTWSELGEIGAGVFLSNPASRHVLEKCGFQYDGLGLCKAPARGGSVSADRFVLTRRTWAGLKGWRAPIVEGLKLDAWRGEKPERRLEEV
jgi:RimJ/RimL family protein N-acetyltransferase